MTGARIEVKFDDAELRAGFQRVMQLTKRFDPLLRSIGERLWANTKERFDTATDPFGHAWKPLSKRYAARKKPGLGILRLNLFLDKSIRYQIVGPTSVAVGSNLPYAAIHQFGGTFQREARSVTVFRKLKKTGEFAKNGRFVKRKLSNFSTTHQAGAHQMTMPARPFLGFGPKDREAALEATALTIGHLLRKA